MKRKTSIISLLSIMKNHLYALLIILFINNALYGKSRCGLFFGYSSSSFRTTQSESISGYVFGVGIDWQIHQRIFIGSEVFYTTRGGIIKDKIVGGYDVKYAYLNDIHCSFRSIEIPITLKYVCRITKDIKLTTMIGPSLSIAVKDKSKREKTQFLFEVKNSNEWDNRKYDYEYNIDSSGPLPYIAKSSGIALKMGIGLEWSFLKIEGRYTHDYFDVETLRSVFLYEKLQSVQILLGIVI